MEKMVNIRVPESANRIIRKFAKKEGRKHYAMVLKMVEKYKEIITHP